MAMLTKQTILERIEQSIQGPSLSTENKELLLLFYDNPATHMDEITVLIEKNPVMSEVILSSANSPIFGLQNPVTSIRKAVLILGAESVCNMAIQEMVYSHYPPQKEKEPHFNIDEYWHHLLAVALLADKIGSITHHNDVFRLFSYGMLHDLGTIVLDLCCPDLSQCIEEKVKAGLHPMVAEKIMLGGLTHAELGGFTCIQLGLGENLRRIIEYHHEPFECPELNAKTSDDLCILYLSEILGDRYYRRMMNHKQHHSKIDNRVLTHLDIKPIHLTYLEAELGQMVNKFISPYADIQNQALRHAPAS